MTVIGAFWNEDCIVVGGDSRINYGDRSECCLSKVFEYPDLGAILTYAGDVHAILAVREVLETKDVLDSIQAAACPDVVLAAHLRSMSEDKDDDCGDVSGILAYAKGILSFDSAGSAVSIPKDTLHFLGTGCEYAYGAAYILSKKRPSQDILTKALVAACECSSSCGIPVVIKKISWT